jgi:hypothetical protein
MEDGVTDASAFGVGLNRLPKLCWNPARFCSRQPAEEATLMEDFRGPLHEENECFQKQTSRWQGSKQARSVSDAKAILEQHADVLPLLPVQPVLLLI